VALFYLVEALEVLLLPVLRDTHSVRWRNSAGTRGGP
jgi:hypothetical protein